MSAQIPDTLLVSEVLKPTGFDCPEDLVGVTFNEATSGSTSAELENNKEVTITENGTIEITPTAGHNYEGMKKVTALINVVGGDIEANKAATIDVSTYTEPVEITPTAGKDGMAKATVTLTNIPSGGSITLYAWNDVIGASTAYTLSETPSVGQYALYGQNDGNDYNQCALVEITEVQSNFIKITNDGGTMQLNRNDSRDINF